jgi:hypothetical protein
VPTGTQWHSTSHQCHHRPSRGPVDSHCRLGRNLARKLASRKFKSPQGASCMLTSHATQRERPACTSGPSGCPVQWGEKPVVRVSTSVPSAALAGSGRFREKAENYNARIATESRAKTSLQPIFAGLRIAILLVGCKAFPAKLIDIVSTTSWTFSSRQ